MRRALVGVVCVLVFVSGCVPDRDNPDDVLNRPQARLQVVQREADGLCVAVGSRALGGWGAVDSASRGRCIGLDARASFDPQGEAITYRFFYSTGGGATFDVTPAPGDVAGVATLDVDWVRNTLPPRRGFEFGVQVSAGGGTNQITVPFFLLNGPPRAVVPPPTFLALGGLPWTPGAPYSVSFRPDVDDPDGDPPVEFCWTFESGGTGTSHCSADPLDPGFTQAIASTSSARVVATLTVSDGDLVSDPLSTYAVVAPSVSMARDDIDGFYALDPIAPVQPLPSLAGLVLDYAPGDDRVFLSVAHHPEFHLQLRDAVLGTIFDEVTLTGSFLSGSPAFDTAGERVWVAGIADDNTFRAIMRSYSVAGDVFVAGLPDFDLGFTVNNAPAVAAVADGSVYAVGPYVGGEQHVVRVRTANNAPFYAVEPVYVSTECCFGDPTYGGAGIPRPRPAHAEMWIPQERYGNNPSFLGRFAVGDAPQLLETDGFRITSIAWVTSAHLWALADNQGALLLDADALASGVPLTQAILVHHPEVTTGAWIECDTATQTCLAGGSSEAWRFVGDRMEHLPGMVDRSSQPGTPFKAKYLDRLGAVWGAGPQRIYSTRPDRVVHEFHRIAGVAVYDPETGGAWISGQGPLLRIAADGQLLRVVQNARRNGVVGVIDSYYYLLPEPGGALWGVESQTGQIARIANPTADVPDITTVQAGSLDDMQYFHPVVTPSGPAAWHTHADYPDQVALLALDGTITNVFTVPEAGGVFIPTKAAASPLTGALCIATSTDFSTPNVIHARRITLTGGVADFGAIGSTDPVTEVAHSRTVAGDDLCWMASANPVPGSTAVGCTAGNEGRIRAWDSAGTLLVDVCVPGKVRSLRATNENEFQFFSTAGGTESLTFATRPAGAIVLTEFPTPHGAPLRFLD